MTNLTIKVQVVQSYDSWHIHAQLIAGIVFWSSGIIPARDLSQ